MNSESESEENARLKSSNYGKLPGGKRKKDDLEGEEAVNVTSYSKAESGGKASRQQYTGIIKEVTQLKNNFRKLQKSVQCDLSEIKENLRLLCEKLGHKYFKKVSYPGTSEKISSANDSSNSDDGTFVAPKA